MSRRLAPYLLTVGTLAALVAAPATVAASGRPDGSPAVTGRVGHVAFVSPAGKVKVVAVKVSGKTLHETKIGPLTKPPAGDRVSVYSFLASGDRNWLAWQEVVTKPSGAPVARKATIVVRELKPSHVWTIKTDDYPLGFAGDDLVTNGAHTSRVVLDPTPRLEKVPGTHYPEAVYPDGLVEVKPLSSPPGPKDTERLELTSFAGKTTVLHNYVLGPNDARLPETAYVSGDGKQVAVERGDHTDFGGIGPSSLVDEYSLHGSHTRSLLGHYGTAAAAWRVGDMSFAWPDDEEWAVWERATKHGAASAVAVHQHGTWRTIVPDGIAVAGNSDGYVVAQAGKYVFDSDGLQVTRVPTGDAILLHDKLTKIMGISGSAFAWVK
jgi:hypothetical protein